MLDFADLVAINKFDKRGSLDALRDVRKQYKRNRQLWDAADETLPIFGTIAAQFNDAGMNRLFTATLKDPREEDRRGPPFRRSVRSSRAQHARSSRRSRALPRRDRRGRRGLRPVRAGAGGHRPRLARSERRAGDAGGSRRARRRSWTCRSPPDGGVARVERTAGRRRSGSPGSRRSGGAEAKLAPECRAAPRTRGRRRWSPATAPTATSFKVRDSVL